MKGTIDPDERCVGCGQPTRVHIMAQEKDGVWRFQTGERCGYAVLEERH